MMARLQKGMAMCLALILLVSLAGAACAQGEEAFAQSQAKSGGSSMVSSRGSIGDLTGLAQLLRVIFFEAIRVEGNSMRSTLLDGEVMIVTKLDYLFGEPSHGDVVICTYPGRTEYFVKRLIGKPGDTIEIVHNLVYRNGEPLDEPYLIAECNDDGFSMEPYRLGDEEYFVMGDNRDNSHDSRNYYGYTSPASLSRSQIIGHVRWVIFPFDSLREIQ